MGEYRLVHGHVETDLEQNYNHFTGVDYDAKTETKAIYKVCRFAPSALPDGGRSRETARLGPTTWTTRRVRPAVRGQVQKS